MSPSGHPIRGVSIQGIPLGIPPVVLSRGYTLQGVGTHYGCALLYLSIWWCGDTEYRHGVLVPLCISILSIMPSPDGVVPKGVVS